ncbi:hypothetical protein [Dyadobacter sandarakinus]|uniref:LTXXQ motif family protein n=1 Tax=Dyadobacter sandarakinus TaxID=2747268 RepID=A0ABX7I9Q5_9BACT|nr:hypothetical protein [Dyadobacter sandarakinus]QRR02458.1 hypothetical protein HWI92_16835 [Dyadobacter sandarakinus]
MKKLLTIACILAGLWLGGCATSGSSATGDNYQTEEPVYNSKLNNRRLEKNMEQFAEELQLTKRQQKQLKKIDRRYAKMERKMRRKDDTRRRDRKRLQEEKRREMIEVLTAGQQQKLQELSRKGRFSLDQIFGK